MYLILGILKAPQSYKFRRNLEAPYTVLVKPILNEQKDSEILTLFRNALT